VREDRAPTDEPRAKKSRWLGPPSVPVTIAIFAVVAAVAGTVVFLVQRGQRDATAAAVIAGVVSVGTLAALTFLTLASRWVPRESRFHSWLIALGPAACVTLVFFGINYEGSPVRSLLGSLVFFAFLLVLYRWLLRQSP
jgi:uncharacterized membrane protein